MVRGFDSLFAEVFHWYMYWRRAWNSVREAGEPKSFQQRHLFATQLSAGERSLHWACPAQGWNLILSLTSWSLGRTLLVSEPQFYHLQCNVGIGRQ